MHLHRTQLKKKLLAGFQMYGEIHSPWPQSVLAVTVAFHCQPLGMLDI